MSDEGGVTLADLRLERRTEAVTPWSCKGALGRQWASVESTTGHRVGQMCDQVGCRAGDITETMWGVCRRVL